MNVSKDTLAGFINAVVSVPDGLASAALAGVNPVCGLYTSIAAPIVGSAMVSAQLMQISTTSASALAAGQAVASYPPDRRGEALFLLVVLTGVCLALFGALRLGRLVRFVSHAVMTGFLAGVAAVLVLDQSAALVATVRRAPTRSFSSSTSPHTSPASAPRPFSPASPRSRSWWASGARGSQRYRR